MRCSSPFLPLDGNKSQWNRSTLGKEATVPYHPLPININENTKIKFIAIIYRPFIGNLFNLIFFLRENSQSPKASGQTICALSEYLTMLSLCKFM